MPMTTDGDKILYECILCHRPFQFGPHVYDGRHIAVWGVEICSRCIAANWDGIMLDRHPDLVERLNAKGVQVTLNQKGWLNIPSS
jgi:hypothetical protein